MKLLHVSNYHYKSGDKDLAGQALLIEKLVEAIKAQDKIDFILFTGDLVFSGSERRDFDLASDQFLKAISIAANVSKPNVLICAGNHDVDRKKVVEPIKQFFRKIKDSDELTKIVEANDPNVYGLSCEPTQKLY
jgi:predicted MPP superfamily phosphohydrolase